MRERSRIAGEIAGRRFVFEAAPGLFSADRVDDGTRLLLAHLPLRAPRSVLDLGCGYGALGLPIAAMHPDAAMLLVDRDLLAVEAAALNAAANGLKNVRAQGSLGYRDVGYRRFDWVLCNVPARIGDDAIAYILGAGAARLTDDGELRVVVIRDLGPVIERVAQQHGWPITLAAAGARHLVYALGPTAWEGTDHETFYRRDTTQVEARLLERPHDLSEEPAHLRDGLPLLLECLPKTGTRDALVWRGGYGAIAIALSQRGFRVMAADRDLLATTFTRRNAARAGVALGTRDRTRLGEALSPDETFEIVVGELTANGGAEAAREELIASISRLNKGGFALWLGLEKLVRDWIEPLGRDGKLGVTKLATRGSYAVVRVRATA